MPDAPTSNTQDLANTEYDAQRRARAAAAHQPAPPDAPPPSADASAEADQLEGKEGQNG
ncbi:hypothetical protein [Methylobacterium pseudosasicola]|uniref:Uncharacterized protein n=1 Tax=Methylobacterium pseudosasicola TaxID=582667 RepID=A0A1I4RCX3_9HYPH|nr:hypothetical protein [Methylobacterium pseudosasicola]SFM50138.1 hypothetical protein SAMN05192568_10353 [Methylobacterium pseudosasicola]